MNYYSLTNSTELSDIGFYPQTEFFNGYSELNKNQNYYKRFIDNGKIKINNKSIVTNLLDISPTLSKGLIVDEKLKNILSEFSLPSHKFYQIPTTYKNKNVSFYWLNFVTSTRHLDFNKSYFNIINSIDNNIIGNLKLKSIDFYNRISKSLTFEEHIKISKLTMKDSFPKNDLIFFGEISIRNLISQKLKKRLEEENINGIVISEVNLF